MDAKRREKIIKQIIRPYNKDSPTTVMRVGDAIDLAEKAAAEEIFKALDAVECPYCGKPTVCVDGECECAEITKLKKKFGAE